MTKTSSSAIFTIHACVLAVRLLKDRGEGRQARLALVALA